MEWQNRLFVFGLISAFFSNGLPRLINANKRHHNATAALLRTSLRLVTEVTLGPEEMQVKTIILLRLSVIILHLHYFLIYEG